MMLTQKQLQKIWLLSDTILYPEAVAFMRKLVEEQKLDPLPTTQVAGLLSIAESENYPALMTFVEHQRKRDWPPSKRTIVAFYSTLEDILTFMQQKRLIQEFRLLAHQPGRSADDTRQEMFTLMALLAREFIQHLLAENGAQMARLEDERKRQRMGRR